MMLITLYVLTTDTQRNEGGACGEPHLTRASAVESLRGWIVDRDYLFGDNGTPYDAMDEGDLIDEASEHNDAASIEEYQIELEANALELCPAGLSQIQQASDLMVFAEQLHARAVALVKAYEASI